MLLLAEEFKDNASVLAPVGGDRALRGDVVGVDERHTFLLEQSMMIRGKGESSRRDERRTMEGA